MSNSIIQWRSRGWNSWNGLASKAVSWSADKTLKLLPDRIQGTVREHCINHVEIAMYSIQLTLLSELSLALPVSDVRAYALIGIAALATSGVAMRLAKEWWANYCRLPSDQRFESGVIAPALTCSFQLFINGLARIDEYSSLRKIIAINLPLVCLAIGVGLIRNGVLVRRNNQIIEQQTKENIGRIAFLKQEIELLKKCIEKFDQFVSRHPKLLQVCLERKDELGSRELDEMLPEDMDNYCKYNIIHNSCKHNLLARMRLILSFQDLTDLFKECVDKEKDSGMKEEIEKYLLMPADPSSQDVESNGQGAFLPGDFVQPRGCSPKICEIED